MGSYHRQRVLIVGAGLIDRMNATTIDSFDARCRHVVPGLHGDARCSDVELDVEFQLFPPQEAMLMVEEMTIEEIESKFDSEWVLIGDPRTDEPLDVLGGRVLCHSKDRDEVHREAVSLRPKRSAVVYTGEIPEDTAVVL